MPFPVNPNRSPTGVSSCHPLTEVRREDGTIDLVRADRFQIKVQLVDGTIVGSHWHEFATRDEVTAAFAAVVRKMAIDRVISWVVDAGDHNDEVVDASAYPVEQIRRVYIHDNCEKD